MVEEASILILIRTQIVQELDLYKLAVEAFQIFPERLSPVLSSHNLLIDIPKSNNLDVARYNYSDSMYLKASTRPIVNIVRTIINQWWLNYCRAVKDEKKIKDLKNNFISNETFNHQGAYFDLYLHNFLTSMGAKLTVAPLLNGSYPDFLVSYPGLRDFYLEATTLSLGKDFISHKNLYQIADKLNEKIKMNKLGLKLEMSPIGSKPLELPNKFVEEVKSFVKNEETRDDFSPALKEFKREDTIIKIETCLKRNGLGKDIVHSIILPGFDKQRIIERVRKAIKEKAKKYEQQADYPPLIVAIDLIIPYPHCYRSTILNALFGTITKQIVVNEQEVSYQKKDGLYFLDKKINFLAVLFFINIYPFSLFNDEHTSALYLFVDQQKADKSSNISALLKNLNLNIYRVPVTRCSASNEAILYNQEEYLLAMCENSYFQKFLGLPEELYKICSSLHHLLLQNMLE